MTDELVGILCEGCGRLCSPEDMQPVPTLVNLRDGTQRYVLFDGETCCDFWDESKPGDFEKLASGEEVQLADWLCGNCDSVCPYDMMRVVTDMDYEDDRTAIVCSICVRKEKQRFKVKG